jgi:dehydrogenase/reductase SDR family protein 1
MNADRAGKVAIVTGASRGIGRGAALGLGEAGWTVYLTGRTVRDGDSERAGSLTATANEVTDLGGHGIPLACDHRDDRDVQAAFDRVLADAGAIDLLVNNATAYATELGTRGHGRFWEEPFEDWDAMHTVGLRSHFVASAFVARAMIPRGHGLIVNISSIGAVKYTGNVSYNVVKAGVDMLTKGTAEELRPYGIAVLSIWPRLTRTAAIVAHADQFPTLDQAWTPLFVGRMIAALAADPNILERSGQALDADVIARDYGVTDVDGRQPQPR